MLTGVLSVFRGGALGPVQPPARTGGPGQVLHGEGPAEGAEPGRGREGGGGQLAGLHDAALQQRRLAGRRLLPPGRRKR